MMKIYDNENDNNHLNLCQNLNGKNSNEQIRLDTSASALQSESESEPEPGLEPKSKLNPQDYQEKNHKVGINGSGNKSYLLKNKLRVKANGKTPPQTKAKAEVREIIMTDNVKHDKGLAGARRPSQGKSQNQNQNQNQNKSENLNLNLVSTERRPSRFGGSLKLSDFPSESTEMSVVTCLPVETAAEDETVTNSKRLEGQKLEAEEEPELLVISVVGASGDDPSDNNLVQVPANCETSVSSPRLKDKQKHTLWWSARMHSHCSDTKSTREKKLWCSLSILTFLTTGLLISVILLALHPKDEHSGICLSPECVITAERVLNSMDPTINPCDDFFKYSCGGWVAKNPIPESSSNWDQFDVLREKMNQRIRSILERDPDEADPQPVLLAQKIYQMCLLQDNKDNHTELQDLADTMAGGTSDDENLGVTLGRIRRELNGNYLLTIYVFFDEKNPTHNTIYIDQPTFGVAIPHFLDKNENKFVMAYEQLIKDTWPFVFPNATVNSTEIAADMIGFERQLATIVTRMEKRRNRTALYNPMTLKTLVEILPPEINWTEYLKQVFLETDVQMDWDNVTIIVKDVAYFQAIGSVLSNTSHTLIRNYLKWRIIFQFGNAVSSKFQQRVFEYLKVTSGIQYPPPKWKLCSEWVNRNMGWAVSYRYVQSNFKSDFKKQVSSIVKDIRDGFYDILKESDWIGNKTKEIAYGKAQAMRSFVAYPEWLMEDRQALNNEFNGLLSQPFDKNHFNNFVKMTKWANQKSLKEMGKEKDYSKWISYSTVVNAFYSASYNAIAFPAGILQIPFYGFPLESMNYGGIGAVIGHEITHAFDDEGAQSDAKGRLINWWDEDTLAKYAKKARCFVYQYGNFSVPELNTTLNGINTQGENIADNGGLRQAFRGYQAYVRRYGEEKMLPGLNFTPNQLFFVAFAQSLCGSYRLENLQQQILTSRHSPWKFQVQGSVANSIDFAETWKCNIPMEPCQIW